MSVTSDNACFWTPKKWPRKILESPELNKIKLMKFQKKPNTLGASPQQPWLWEKNYTSDSRYHISIKFP